MKATALRQLFTICILASGVAVAAPPPGGGMPGMGAPGGMMGGEGMMGGMPRAGKISGAMAKLFGKNTSFSADVVTQIAGEKPLTVPGKLIFDQGKLRSEISLADAKGGQVSPEMAAHMKTMGMDKVVAISRPDKNLEYIVYPAMEAYVEMEIQSGAAGEGAAYSTKVTELGKETLEGHPVTKNKVTVNESADRTNAVLEATVWNAADLNDFPLKIEQTSEGVQSVTVFKNVKFEKASAGMFEPPQGFQKHRNMMELMQAMVMKQMGGMQMPPPGKKRQNKQ